MKHIKLFEQFINEGKEVNTIVDFLENMADKGWKKFNISSGSDLYEDPVKQEKYIEFVKSEIKKANLSNDILKFGKNIHDELESDNFHHLNMLLALAGYYKPDVKSRYMSYLKNRPKDSFALDLFEKSVNEYASPVRKEVKKLISKSSDPDLYGFINWNKDDKSGYVSAMDDIENILAAVKSKYPKAKVEIKPEGKLVIFE